MKVHRIVRRFVRQLCGQSCLALLWLLGVAALVQAQTARSANEAVLSLDTQVVSLTVTVSDKQGRHVSGLEQGAFALFEDQVAQEISYFTNTDTPASIVVVFDLSGSMRDEKIKRSQLALERFLQNCHADDEYSLIGFNDHAWVALDRTRDPQQLLRQFSSVKPEGNTALYDAVALGLRQLEKARYPRRVLLVISDGDDNHSRASLRQIKRQVNESAALIYAIGVHDFSLRNQIGGLILHELTEPSGGKAFFPKDGEAMSEAFEKIALELRQQYSIGYTPSNFSADGKWRKLKVKVTPPPETPGIVVRARVGYYANPKRPGAAAEEVEAAHR
ncbi:MAG: VWA domain-containing protein [Acidobacteria bacterium]|nr:VWA domain-containing protein [Acidobacteriota bacterium]MBI3425286.1 VWA domain-containing protein [Acidobacteriota bacterium]